MTLQATPNQDAKERVTKLFGLYRAEWMNGQLFDLFTEPQYFGQLKSSRPSVLIGGRGTGKTTVLKGLSYEGQYALRKAPGESPASWNFVGLYYRADTNRVSAFTGQDLPEDRWIRCFAHYLNLQFCTLLLDFVAWYERTTLTTVVLPDAALRRVCTAMHLDFCGSVSALAEAIDLATIAFEASINNIADAPPSTLSLQKAPVDELVDAIRQNQVFRDKHFAFLIDEYENLDDYQQRVVNTLIKHANPRYSFIIGVRELGWRVRSTLNANEQLTHPADYTRIDIVQDLNGAQFADFAAKVCNERLARSRGDGAPLYAHIQDAFPALTLDEEAELLGVQDFTRDFISETCESNDPQALAYVERQRPAMLSVMTYWARSQNVGALQVVADAQEAPARWADRYNNYAHAVLFSLRRGKRGIHKYYAGWDVFVLLSNGNIRFLLELVHQALLSHASQHALDVPVAPKVQTEAAQHVGKKYLDELEGLASEGGRLTKLVLGLGRVFQVLAEQPEGHAPEINQFCVVESKTSQRSTEVHKLLRMAIMHLALVASAGTKQTDVSDTLEYDYMLHPVFSPFFEFSHRRKRKLELTPDQIMALIENPSAAIRSILGNKASVDDATLPDQMLLFQGFYRGDRR